MKYSYAQFHSSVYAQCKQKEGLVIRLADNCCSPLTDHNQVPTVMSLSLVAKYNWKCYFLSAWKIAVLSTCFPFVWTDSY